MALPSAQDNPASLTLRVVSGAVMLPVAVGATWFGGWIFALLVALAAALMYWEWQGLCGEKGGTAQVLAALCGLGIMASVWAGPWTSIVVAVAAGFLVGLPSRRHRIFLAAGIVYILVACLSLVWLRSTADSGFPIVIWLMAVVVVTDTAAYFTGKTVGGPKLAPRISPKKTWAGLIGGIVGAGVAGGLVALGFSGPNFVALGLLGGGFAIVAQAGDLLVSKAKRHFGIKDSGDIIPGHGGVLDRLDGFLSTAIVLAALTILGGGSPLAWR